MQSNAIAAVLCGLIALALLQSANAIDKCYGDVQIGQHRPGERLLDEKLVEKEWKFGQRVTATYSYSSPGYTITYIDLYGNRSDEHNAGTFTIGGGIGDNSIEINFKSDPFRGLKFTVKIYGIPSGGAHVPKIPYCT